MKLPRYPIARSVTSELQAGRGALLTPAEAARSELAKLGAVTSVMDATNKVIQVEEQARAEEEYTDAVFDYESQLQEYDVEVSTKGFELDENNNIIVDDKQMVKDELAYRKELADQVRGRMSSPAGKRQFDKYMTQSNLRRNQEYTQQAVSRRVKALGAQAEHKVDTLMLEGKFELALERAKKGVEDGVIGADQYDDMKFKIGRAKSQDTITDTLKSGSTADMYEMVESLKDGKLPDGSDALLLGDEEYAYTTKLNARIAQIDDVAFSELDKAREEQYMDLLEGAIGGSISVADLRPYRYVLDDKRYDKLVGYAVTSSRRPQDSDPAIKEGYERRINELRVGRGYEHVPGGFQDSMYDIMDAMALDADLSASDVDVLTDRLDGYVTAIRDNDGIEALLDVELTKITGRSQSGLDVLIEGADKSNYIWASRLERDYKEAMVEVYRGKRYLKQDAEKWLKENVPYYHAQVQKDILDDYSLGEYPMTQDGKIDIDALGVGMLQSLTAREQENQTGTKMTDTEIRQQIEYDLMTLERLVGAG